MKFPRYKEEPPTKAADYEPHLTRYEINLLAHYNDEVSRGLLHTEEWKVHMADIQERFDAAPYPSTKAGRRWWKNLV